MSAEECYKAGYDCGLNGANETNSHFKFFLTNAKSEAWSKGKKDAGTKKEKQNNNK